jgi:hypothetical protein
VNGLRIFILDVGVGGDQSVFYSRRADGPYYRWSYEQTMEQWRSVRVHSAELPHLTFCIWPWKNVPRSLQRSLGEHYVE